MTEHRGNPDCLGTTFAIELSDTPARTRVHLLHAGYPAKNEVYERCRRSGTPSRQVSSAAAKAS